MIVYRIVRLYEHRLSSEPTPSGHFDYIRDENQRPIEFRLTLEEAVAHEMFQRSSRSSYYDSISGAKQGRRQILKWERDDCEEDYPIVSFELTNPTLID